MTSKNKEIIAVDNRENINDIEVKDMTLSVKESTLNKLSFIFIAIAINASFLLIGYSLLDESFENWVRSFAILSIIQLIFNIFSLKIVGEELFSLSTLFIIFTYLFHFGHIFLVGIQADLQYTNELLINTVNNSLLKKASMFTLSVQSFVTSGMMVYLIKPVNCKVKPTGNQEISKQVAHYMGIICILVGIIPMVYIDFSKIIAFFQYGYLATFNLTVRNIYIIARLTIVGVMLLIIANKENKKLSTVLVIITIIYEIFSMISGSRGKAVVTIISFIYLYTKVVNKLKFRIIFIYLASAYLLMLLINTIKEFRLISGDFHSFIEILSSQNFLNPINDMIYEFGGTMLTVCYSMLYFPQYVPIQWGSNYLFSVFIWLPSNIGNLDYFINKVQYISYFPGDTEQFMGGSYVGELYYSFNYFGIIISFFIGMFVALISMKIRENILNQNIIKIVLNLILFSNILWWVRDYFGGIFRELIWTSLFLYFLNIFVTFYLKRKINT